MLTIYLILFHCLLLVWAPGQPNVSPGCTNNLKISNFFTRVLGPETRLAPVRERESGPGREGASGGASVSASPAQSSSDPGCETVMW